jgi:hypothetical protein
MISLSLALAIQASVFRSGLARDADVLEQAYVSMHPGLYRYCTRKEMQANFDRLRMDWAQCRGVDDAYVALSEFTAKVKCGHTYPNFFNQEPSIVNAVFSGNNRVPFYFRWLYGHMVVLKDFTPAGSLPKGTEIEKIDGIPCVRILKRLMTIARADGANDDKRRAYLSVTGDDRFEAFDIYLPLMFSIPPGKFTFVVRDLRGKLRTVSTRALSMEDRASAYRKAAPAVPWRLLVKGRYAILTMPTWQMYDGKWDWQTYLRTCFAKLKKSSVGSLIIDLRGNEGGSSVGDVLAGYLVSKPLRLENYHQYTRYAKVDPALRPYLDTWDRSFDDWSKWTGKPVRVEAGHNSFLPMSRFEPEDGDVIQPQADRFGGRVFVLVDSSNSSATFEFENLVQTHRLAKLVGEPTGGNLRGINGGAFYFLHLPNSHLEVDLPLIGQFPTAAEPDRGLQPDTPVYPTRADIAAGRDVVLERVRRLIERP